jgi:MFS family permease
MGTTILPDQSGPWYRGVTRYQWLVLAIASAGWVFDVFEGQILVSLKVQLLESLIPGTHNQTADDLKHARELVFNIGLTAFLIGGAVGGLLFGKLADRFGRRSMLIATISMYSVFTALTAVVVNVWQFALLRFLVGLGTGGEWAVAAALVAEVFPARSRPAASGIFHASSVLGTLMAIGAASVALSLTWENGWRIGFLIGLLPAVLVTWVRVHVREPESWETARTTATIDSSRPLGRFRDLFASGTLRRRTLLATALAVVGLATFWGTTIRGMDLMRMAKERELLVLAVPKGETSKKAAETFGLLGMFLATIGGGFGLLSFAPLSQRLGRRMTFVFFHLMGFASVVVVTLLVSSVTGLIILLPLFGFFTLGMHGGYAVYFPELFPTRLRSTGAGFCFNAARVVAGPVLLGFAYIQGPPLELGLPLAMLVLSSLFLVGAILVLFAPETRGQPLPE